MDVQRTAHGSVAALLPIMRVVFIAFLVIGLAMPVLPLHVHQGLGLGTFVVGLVAGSQFAAAPVFRMWAGRHADTRGAQAASKGPAQYFTGNVRIEPLFPARDAAPYSRGSITFVPGARSNWHTHPTGQHLIVTSGVGWTREWGGPVVEIRAGDVVWCPPGVKHRHGATPTVAMTQIALTGTAGGKSLDWMEKVSDEQYRKR